MGRPSKYSEEFRADAVALVLTTEIGIAQGARDRISFTRAKEAIAARVSDAAAFSPR